MKCQLVKSNHDYYTIIPEYSDYLSDYSVEVSVDDSLLEEILDIQHKYRSIQKKLRDLDNAEKLSK